MTANIPKARLTSELSYDLSPVAEATLPDKVVERIQQYRSESGQLTVEHGARLVRFSGGDPRLVRWLVGEMNAREAVEACLRSWDFYYTGEERKTELIDENCADACGIDAAALVADGLPTADHARLTAWVRQRWPELPTTHRAMAACILAKDPSVYDEVIPPKGKLGYIYQDLLGATFDLDKAVEFGRRWKETNYRGKYGRWKLYRITVLAARLGAEGAGQVMCALKAPHPDILSVPMAKLFAQDLGHRTKKKAAKAYLEAHPEFALPALEQVNTPEARGLYKAIAMAQGKPVEFWGGPSLRKTAPADLVPPILQNPPWEECKPLKLPDLELAPREIEVFVDWLPDQQQAWLAQQRFQHMGNEGLPRFRTPGGKITSYAGEFLPGLGDQRIEKFWNHVQGPNHTVSFDGDWEAARHVVARLGVDGVPGYVQYASSSPNSAALLFERVASPALASLYAKLIDNQKQLDAALGWLGRYPEHAAVGLIPIALGSAKKSSDRKARAAARNALVVLVSLGQKNALDKIASQYGDEAKAAVEKLVTHPASLLPPKLPKLPTWAEPSSLPAVELHNKAGALSPEAMSNLLMLLACTPLKPPHPGIEQVRKACTPDSLLECCWELCCSWLAEGGKSSGNWVLFTLGHFGGDEAVRRLAPLVAKWPSQSGRHRAMAALDVFDVIGTDLALSHLFNLAATLKQKAFRETVQAKVENIARRRRLSREELADRAVPTLGLNHEGRLELAVSGGTFFASMGPDLKPLLRDESGQRKKDLPKTKSEETAKVWRQFKKDSRSQLKQQGRRMETMMTSQRHLTPSDFEAFFARHPFMCTLAKRLLWASYSATGVLKVPLRLDDAGALLDGRGNHYEVPSNHGLGIVHPLQLSEAAKKAWQETMKGVQPFEQLHRPYFLPKSPAETGELLAPITASWEPRRIHSLRRGRWHKGQTEEAGNTYETLWPLGDQEVVLPHGVVNDEEYVMPTIDVGLPFVRDRWSFATEGQSIHSLSPIQRSEVILSLRRGFAIDPS